MLGPLFTRRIGLKTYKFFAVNKGVGVRINANRGIVLMTGAVTVATIQQTIRLCLEHELCLSRLAVPLVEVF